MTHHEYAPNYGGPCPCGHYSPGRVPVHTAPKTLPHQIITSNDELQLRELRRCVPTNRGSCTPAGMSTTSLRVQTCTATGTSTTKTDAKHVSTVAASIALNMEIKRLAWHHALPPIKGNTARIASSPSEKALYMQLPMSTTSVATSSSAMFARREATRIDLRIQSQPRHVEIVRNSSKSHPRADAEYVSSRTKHCAEISTVFLHL